MSGGGYNYLCHASWDELESKRNDIEAMRDRLIELGYLDAAKETEGLLLAMDVIMVKLQARMARLNTIWHAVEWYDSGDYYLGQVEEEIQKYRELI